MKIHDICCKKSITQAVTLIEIEVFAGSINGEHQTKDTFPEKSHTATVRNEACKIIDRLTNSIGLSLTFIFFIEVFRLYTIIKNLNMER